MKKGVLLNSELSYVVSNMRHTDTIVIGDAGLPVPDPVKQIDLAVTKGVPDFITVLETVLSELRVEKVTFAEEFKTRSPHLHDEALVLLKKTELEEGITITVEYISHEKLKEKTDNSKAVVRTGEFTPFANIILTSGVVF
jgi:D-ribose pyranase